MVWGGECGVVWRENEWCGVVNVVWCGGRMSGVGGECGVVWRENEWCGVVKVLWCSGRMSGVGW